MAKINDSLLVEDQVYISIEVDKREMAIVPIDGENTIRLGESKEIQIINSIQVTNQWQIEGSNIKGSDYTITKSAPELGWGKIDLTVFNTLTPDTTHIIVKYTDYSLQDLTLTIIPSNEPIVEGGE